MHLGWTHQCQKVKSIPQESVNHFLGTDVSGPGALRTSLAHKEKDLISLYPSNIKHTPKEEDPI